MHNDPKLLEKDAHSLLSQGNHEEAYRLFIRAAQAYLERRNHKEAALCFASAASSWAMKQDEKAFLNSASAYEEAARQAELAMDLEYASLMYRYAAIAYERDMEFSNFSECFYHSKESQRRFLTNCLFRPGSNAHIGRSGAQKGLGFRLGQIIPWLGLNFSSLVWGHGEKPLRTLYCGLGLIIFSTLFYTQCHLFSGGEVFRPNFFQAFYFSVITFTTVGYGDMTPVGLSKAMVMIELFWGMFIMPLFIVSLSRKYLRI